LSIHEQPPPRPRCTDHALQRQRVQTTPRSKPRQATPRAGFYRAASAERARAQCAPRTARRSHQRRSGTQHSTTQRVASRSTHFFSLPALTIGTARTNRTCRPVPTSRLGQHGCQHGSRATTSCKRQHQLRPLLKSWQRHDRPCLDRLLRCLYRQSRTRSPPQRELRGRRQRALR